MSEPHPHLQFKATFKFNVADSISIRTDHRPWEDLEGKNVQYIAIDANENKDISLYAFSHEDAIKRFDQVVTNLDALGYDNVMEKTWVPVVYTEVSS